MPQLLRAAGWSPHRARRAALILILFMALGSSRVVAAPPAFQGTFRELTLSPLCVGLAPSGDVFVGNWDGHMSHFSGTGALIYTWVLGNTAHWAAPITPYGVAVDGSSVIFVTDYFGNRIQKYTSWGFLFSSFVTGLQPVDVAMNSANEVFVMAAGDKQVQKFTNSGSLLASFGSAGSGPGQFEDPQGLAVDGSGRVYVADHTRMRIIRFLANGTFDLEFPTPVPPSDMAVGPDGNIYVISPESGSVYRYSPSGSFQFAFGSPLGLSYVSRICAGPTGAIYITEQHTRRVSKFQIDLNHPPDCSQAAPSVAELWPPDHRFVPVRIVGVTDPDGDPVKITITGVTQDEPTSTLGDGDTCPDAIVSGDSVELRAERTGDKKVSGNGRVYAISFIADDGRGGSSTDTVHVCVPHDRGSGHGCIDDGQTYIAAVCDGRHVVPPTAASFSVNPPRLEGTTAVVEYSLNTDGDVNIAAYDVLGRRLATLEDTYRTSGSYQARWNATGLTAGMYFVRVTVTGAAVTKAMLILR